MLRQTLIRIRNLFLAISIPLTLSACGVGEASVTAAEPTVVPVSVVTAPARRGDAMALHEGTVNLEADSEAAVVARVSGEIREVLVEEGETVAAGQVLARLDGDRLRLQRDQALADLNKLKQEYRRNVELHDRGLVSEGA
ncbi:MAG: biotin/lipoyl-binding protein, partial [Gammaproteobacteria bacterium]